MLFEIVLTTAEDVVAVVDAVHAKPCDCSKEFVCEFTDLTENQAENALHMAEQLSLISFDRATSQYVGKSFLARLMISANNSEQKASIMRLVFEQYEPFITFKSRFIFTESADVASKQVKALYGMNSSYKDIKNTIINIATYSRTIKDEGANMYQLSPNTNSHIKIIEEALERKVGQANLLIKHLGNEAYDYIDKDTVFAPLSDAYSKANCDSIEVYSTVTFAGNAFESFLAQYAVKKGVSLVGKSGIIPKANALSFSKKHKGMIEYVGQVRNAADHGADVNEGNKVWEISEETARIYPLIIANLIKAIITRDTGHLFV